MSTTDVHHRIEEIAVGLLDMLPSIEANPETMAKVAEIAAIRPGLGMVMATAAQHTIATGTNTTVITRRNGPEMALTHAVLLEVLFGQGRAPIEWCPHRERYDDGAGALLVSAALRYAGCPDCALVKAEAFDAVLNADTACDVCGADDDALVTPRMLPFAGALVTIYSGRCCDELFEFSTPNETTMVFRAVGRNEACPCGSTRKYKRCHGATS